MNIKDITPVPGESDDTTKRFYVDCPTDRMTPSIPQGTTMVLRPVDVSLLEVGKAYVINYSVNDYRIPGRLKAIGANCLTLTFDGFDPDHHIRQHYHPLDINTEQIKGCFEIIGSMTVHAM